MQKLLLLKPKKKMSKTDRPKDVYIPELPKIELPTKRDVQESDDLVKAILKGHDSTAVVATTDEETATKRVGKVKRKKRVHVCIDPSCTDASCIKT